MSDTYLKEQTWNAFWEGYKVGYGVEEVTEIDRKAARSRFERYWRRNHE